MAENVRLELVPWEIGTSVSAYRRKSELMVGDGPPPMVVPSVAVAVAADKSLTFAGLAPGEYWAIAPITAGQRDYRYLQFNAH